MLCSNAGFLGNPMAEGVYGVMGLMLASIYLINNIVRGVSVLLAAMPAGATTSMLASKYDQDPQFATRPVIFSTLWSIPAIMLCSMILKV